MSAYTRDASRVFRQKQWFIFLFLGVFVINAIHTPQVSGQQQTVQELFEDVVEIHGSGTTNPSKLYWQTMDLMMARAGRPIILTYRAIGSGFGQEEFINRSNSFGSADIPLSRAQYQSLSEPVLHVPIGLGPVSVFYRLDGVETSSLRLNPCTIAKIFSRRITLWNDPEIVRDNAFMSQFNAPIVVIRRTDASSSTTAFTQYLRDLCAGANGWGELGAGSRINWPIGTIGVEGSDNVAEYVRQNNFTVGYMDSGHGISRNLPEVSLRNRDGIYLRSQEADVSSTAEQAFDDGAVPAALTSDWSAFNLYNRPGQRTWPIIVVTYIYTRQNLTSSGVAGRWVHAYLNFLLSSEIAALMPSVAYVPLPPTWNAFVRDSLAQLLIFHPQTFPVIFEDIITTLPRVGNAPNVVSAKRRTWAEFQRFQLTLDRLEDQGKVIALESSTRQSFATLQDRISRMTILQTDAQTSSANLQNQINDLNNRLQTALAVAIAGLVFGVLGFIVGIAGLIAASCAKTKKTSGNANKAQDYIGGSGHGDDFGVSNATKNGHGDDFGASNATRNGGARQMARV